MNRRWNWALYGCIVAALGVVAQSRALRAESGKPQQRNWDFESDEIGKIASGFKPAFGAWAVAADGKNHVLEQSAASDDSAFNLVLIDDTNYADVELAVKLKAIGGKIDQGGGVVWRARDARNYYIARFNPLEDNFRVYKVVDGKRTQLDSAKVTGGGAQWRTLRIDMRGTHIKCFLDDKLYLEADDATFRGAGKIGLWCKSDAHTYFDDLTAVGEAVKAPADSGPAPTREFEIKNDRAWLGGHEVDLWGIRCGNALFSEAVTERHITNLDNMAAHGINLVGFYIQGANAGWPNPDAGLNGFTRDGQIKPEFARRLERLIRELDRRGMVAMVGLISPRKDQEFYDDAAIERAIEETGRFLMSNKLKNVFVDLCHEFDNPARMDKELLREPHGPEKKARLHGWFKAVAPDIEAGVCPDVGSETANSYPGMEVRFIQKQMPIPKQGFVVNLETLRQDEYQNDGVFNQANRDYIFADCWRYLEAPHAVILFHAAFIQGITNFSGTAPHAEMGGYGTGPNDRGVRFYYEWVRDNVGRWEYPRHVRAH
jgi:hypothetical protein